MIDCEDISTPANDKGDAEGGRNLAFLDRHDVQCPENKVKHETLMKTLHLEFIYLERNVLLWIMTTICLL